jgi:DNA repair exonuclease SbcCD nuclease subunit
MRFLHIADTHLGYQAYAKLDENGLNQREVDCYSAFDQAIDLAIEKKVDFVLHAGDLFNTIRPSNRTIFVALSGISRLAQEDIPFIVISGNHSTPRLRETGSVFRIFDFFDNVHPVYKGRYEPLEMNDCFLHLVPHCLDSTVLAQELKKVKTKEGRNVLALHAGVIGIDVFRMGDFNELLVAPGEIDKGMDYVALGHYHEYAHLFDRAYYPGSTERLSFSEAKREKGVLLVDDGKEEFIPLQTREMLDLEPIECLDLDEKAIMNSIEERLHDLDGKIVRLTLKDLDRSISRALDFKKIKDMGNGALHFELKYSTACQEKWATEHTTIGNLEDEIRDFWVKKGLEGKRGDKLLKLALKYLSGGEG